MIIKKILNCIRYRLFLSREKTDEVHELKNLFTSRALKVERKNEEVYNFVRSTNMYKLAMKAHH